MAETKQRRTTLTLLSADGAERALEFASDQRLEKLARLYDDADRALYNLGQSLTRELKVPVSILDGSGRATQIMEAVEEIGAQMERTGRRVGAGHFRNGRRRY